MPWVTKDLRNMLGSKSDEQIFDSIVAQAKSGGRASKQNLKRMISVLNKEDEDVLKSAIVQSMGRPTASVGSVDEFSVNTFAKNYREFEAGALSQLFPKGSQVRKSLDNLYKVSKSYEKVAKLANHSGTARGNLFYGIVGGGAVLDLWTTASSLLTSYGMAKVLTSPKAARAYVNMVENYAVANEVLRDAARLTPKAKQAAKNYSAALNNLRAWMLQQEDLAPQAENFANELQLEPIVSRGE
ncbi:MAG: hypothetical protein AAF228_12130 [Pseudomonadota bacterium]